MGATWGQELSDFGVPSATTELQFVFRPPRVDPERPWLCYMKDWGAEILPDGSVMVSFRNGGRGCDKDSYPDWPSEQIGLARADCWNCEYAIITEEPLFQGQHGGGHNEDSFLFWTHRGLHLVMHSQDRNDPD